MTGRVIQQPWMQWAETKALAGAFAKAKKEMRFVGGCVRDSLLGRPVKDIDIATPALPEEVITLLGQAQIRAIPTGIDHGTVTALIDGKHFEITTLRRDVACDGRHAEVEYTDDWKQDAARRDFTINALFASASGEVFDYFDGLTHLSPLRILFIGNAEARIEEDALRILRFFRFSAQLGAKEFDAGALRACAAHAELVARLSGERIAQEMLKLLAVPQLDKTLLLHMQQAGVVRQLGLPVLPDAVAHFSFPDALARLALWLMQGGDAEALGARWKLSNAQALELRQLTQAASALTLKPAEKEQKKLLRAFGKNIFSCAARMVHFPDAALLAEGWPIPEFPVTGQDLLEHGYTEGKALGDKLKALEAAWEAADYRPTREELLKTP